MKKLFVFSLSFALASACGSSASQKEKEASAEEAPVATETVQEEVQQENAETEVNTPAKVQNSMLLGEIEKKDFLSPPFASWFNANYDSYEPAPEAMETIEGNISEVDEIVVYMGTWCPDSKREVPKFFRILDMANYDLDQVKMVAVDRSKNAPDNSQEEYGVFRVPTFIFYKDGEEIGRFVENPRETLEKDVAKIVSGVEYKHSYEN